MEKIEYFFKISLTYVKDSSRFKLSISSVVLSIKIKLKMLEMKKNVYMFAKIFKLFLFLGSRIRNPDPDLH